MRSSNFSKNVLLTVAIGGFSLMATVPAVVQAEGSPLERVRQILSGYEVPYKLSDLERMAGGKDALVAILLELRNDDETRFVSTRSEEVLLRYSDREDVLTALKTDLANPLTPGHAIAIVTHIDMVPALDKRRELAKIGAQRAAGEESFHPYVRLLSMNADSQIQKSAAPFVQK